VEDTYQKILTVKEELGQFFRELTSYIIKNLHLSFLRFEEGKGIFVAALYRQRGKQARRLIHTGMASLAAVGMMIAPVIADEFPGRSVNPWDLPTTASVLSARAEDTDTTTVVSEKVRDKTIGYTVQQGDTVSTIANKFGVSEDTILWQNDLTSKNQIKVGETLQILPVTGVSHKVQKGDTIYSIAKKYDASSQAIVDFPYNTFVNDETFQLAVGQTIIVPDGVKRTASGASPRIRQSVPDAGTVVASGRFVWPTGGVITQNFSWYHPAIDIANPRAPQVVAADSGTIVYSGCITTGYGCHVIIDHGNGYRTLYAHLQKIYVTVGQTVRRGGAIGQMGSTGRSTGTHTHFEVIKNGVHINPLSVLR
jgi:murein DD-endopeptidase MepM/ murein hydrolase activator NlpD